MSCSGIDLYEQAVKNFCENSDETEEARNWVREYCACALMF